MPPVLVMAEVLTNRTCVTGAGTKSWWLSRASRCLAGFLERNGVEVLAHCHQAVASGCFLFRWQLRSGATWSEGKASKSAVLAHGHQASVSETLVGLLSCDCPPVLEARVVCAVRTGGSISCEGGDD